MKDIIKGWGCGLTLTIATLLVLGVVGYGIAAAELEWWLPFKMNAERHAVENSRSNVEGKQAQINAAMVSYETAMSNYHVLYGTPTTAQQASDALAQAKAQAQVMCNAADDIRDNDDIPHRAQTIMIAEGCWTP